MLVAIKPHKKHQRQPPETAAIRLKIPDSEIPVLSQNKVNSKVWHPAQVVVHNKALTNIPEHNACITEKHINTKPQRRFALSTGIRLQTGGAVP